MAGRAALLRAGGAGTAAKAGEDWPCGSTPFGDQPTAVPSPSRLAYGFPSAASRGAHSSRSRSAYEPWDACRLPCSYGREKKRRGLLRRALSCFLPQ